MTKATMQFSMDNELIAPVIEAHLRAAIINALGGRESIIEEIVSSVLNAKVDKDGNPPRYSSDGKYTLLEWLCQQAIRDATKQAITDIVTERSEDLYKEVRRQMEDSKGAWVRAMLAGLAEAAGNHWKFNVEVKIPESY